MSGGYEVQLYLSSQQEPESLVWRCKLTVIQLVDHPSTSPKQSILWSTFSLSRCPASASALWYECVLDTRCLKSLIIHNLWDWCRMGKNNFFSKKSQITSQSPVQESKGRIFNVQVEFLAEFTFWFRLNMCISIYRPWGQKNRQKVCYLSHSFPSHHDSISHCAPLFLLYIKLFYTSRKDKNTEEKVAISTHTLFTWWPVKVHKGVGFPAIVHCTILVVVSQFHHQF